MSIVVLLTAKAKEDQYDNLVTTMKTILPDTAARDGAEMICAAANPEDKSVIVYEVWDKPENQQAYLKWRAERGDLEKLAALLREPPTFEKLDQVV
jgi:quinol monooxygenase YgiN